jgi:hypothetical protein
MNENFICLTDKKSFHTVCRCAQSSRSNVDGRGTACRAPTRRSSRALHMEFLTGLPDMIWLLSLLVIVISRRWREVPLQLRCRNPIASIFLPCFHPTMVRAGKTAAGYPKD